MLGNALDWLGTAQQCFADEFGQLTRGLLTSTKRFYRVFLFGFEGNIWRATGLVPVGLSAGTSPAARRKCYTSS